MSAHSTPAPRRPDPARLAAVRAYVGFREGGQFRSTAPSGMRDAQQRRLYANLVRGMVRHSRRLEHDASRLAHRRPDQLTPEVLGALVLGLYQLVELQQADHAAIFETVELLGELRQTRAKGFVNAVLRAAQRERTAGGPLVYPGVAVRTSHPDWLVQRWSRAYGEAKALSICEANNRFERSGVRVNLARIERAALLARLEEEGVAAAPHPFLPGGILVTHLAALIESPAFNAGLCYVQDAGSQLLAAWIAPLMRGYVLDACCAPGGKLTHLAEMAQRGIVHPTLLVGLDSGGMRMRRVRENFARLRLDPPALVVADGVGLPFRQDFPDSGWRTILVDAPCSATGMIRKYPELKWSRRPEDIPRMAKTQRALLDAAAGALAPEGHIVYVTCSLEPEENEEQVAQFIARHPDFRRSSFRDLAAPEGLGESIEGMVNVHGDLLILPGDDRMGLYAALIERKP